MLGSDEAEGEVIMVQELQDILGKLVSEYHINTALPENISAERFAEDTLGFEEVDENEDEEGEEGEMGASQGFAGTAPADGSKLGVIQEEP